MSKVPEQSNPDEEVTFFDEDADTLRPSALSLAEQLEHLESTIDNYDVLQTRAIIAKSWEKVLEQIIAACKTKSEHEKNFAITREEYQRLATEGGHHADKLREARQKSENTIDNSNQAAIAITELQSLLQKVRVTDWNNLQIIETRIVATGKYDLNTINTLHTQLKTALKNIRKHLEELKSYNINFDQSNN